MFKTLSVYFVAIFVLLMVVFGLQCLYPKTELHLLLNSYHTSILDTFFKYYSMMAEGLLYVLEQLPLLWKKIRLTIFFALCELSGGSLLQILKHTISAERPVSVFENDHNMILPLVQGVDMHYGNSFPSGHASTFFVFFTCCAFYLAYRYKLKGHQNNRSTWTLFCITMLSFFVFATLGAYSRIYLSQHFLSDVCVGGIIGFVTPCLIFYYGRHKILKLKTE